QLCSESWGVWDDDFWGYSMRTVMDYAPAVAQLHFFAHEPRALSSDAVVAGESVRLQIVDSGTLHAIIGWFTATLVDGVTLSNMPSYPGCNWAVWVWPVRHTPVHAGMVVEAKLERPANVRAADEWRLDCRIARLEAVTAA